MTNFRNQVKNYFKSLQSEICKKLSQTDSKSKFSRDKWKKQKGGGGITRVMLNGNVIEKGGVNFSAVSGKLPERIAKDFNVPQINYFATGISIVIHPFHPFVPIIHANLRYFELENGSSWFGGGMDLTPVYINVTEVKNFHLGLKKICDTFNKKFYPEFKRSADRYFFIPHRKEKRGAGGIFFDKLGSKHAGSAQEFYPFIKGIGNYFLPAYLPLISANRYKKFNEKHKEFQLFRRGRYVEFNLVYDLGTKFGLETAGRAESILMSLPPLVKWTYDFIPEKDSEEERTMKFLRKK